MSLTDCRTYHQLGSLCQLLTLFDSTNAPIRMSLYESIYITHCNSYVRTYVPLCNANPSKVPVQYGAVPQQGTPTHCVHAPDTDLSHKVSIAKSHQAKPLRACIEGGGGVTDTYQLTQPSRLQACEDSHMHIRMYISM